MERRDREIFKNLDFSLRSKWR